MEGDRVLRTEGSPAYHKNECKKTMQKQSNSREHKKGTFAPFTFVIQGQEGCCPNSTPCPGIPIHDIYPFLDFSTTLLFQCHQRQPESFPHSYNGDSLAETNSYRKRLNHCPERSSKFCFRLGVDIWQVRLLNIARYRKQKQKYSTIQHSFCSL